LIALGNHWQAVPDLWVLKTILIYIIVAVTFDHRCKTAGDFRVYVCVCNAVTDRDIREAASRGVCSVEALGDQLKVATCCGRCLEHASKVLLQAISDGGPASRFGA